MTNYRKMTNLIERWNGPRFAARRLKPDAQTQHTARERTLEARNSELERQLHAANADYIRMRERAAAAEDALKRAGLSVPPASPCGPCQEANAALTRERQQTATLRRQLQIAQCHAVPFLNGGAQSVQRTTAGLWKQVSTLQTELREAKHLAQLRDVTNAALRRQNEAQATAAERQSRRIQALTAKRERPAREPRQSKANVTLERVKAERDEAHRLLSTYRAEGTCSKEELTRQVQSEKSHMALEYGRLKDKYEAEIHRLSKRLIRLGQPFAPVHIACAWWLAEQATGGAGVRA